MARATSRSSARAILSIVASFGSAGMLACAVVRGNGGYTRLHVTPDADRDAVERAPGRTRRAPHGSRRALAAPGGLEAGRGGLVGRRDPRPPDDRRDRDGEADDEAHAGGRGG